MRVPGVPAQRPERPELVRDGLRHKGAAGFPPPTRQRRSLSRGGFRARLRPRGLRLRLRVERLDEPRRDLDDERRERVRERVLHGCERPQAVRHGLRAGVVSVARGGVPRQRHPRRAADSMRSHARRRNRPEDANAWWSSTASDHTTFARFMASNVSTFSRASRSRICVRGSARALTAARRVFVFVFARVSRVSRGDATPWRRSRCSSRATRAPRRPKARRLSFTTRRRSRKVERSARQI